MLDRSNKPLYEQIYEYYKEQIKTGQLKPEDRLPTEMEMAELFNVSRITTRRALDEMQRDGLIYRKKGLGSFVLPLDKAEREKGSNIVAMIIPSDSATGRRIDYIRGATEYLDKKGWFLTVHNTDDDEDRERRFLQELPQSGVSGIIYYPSGRDNFDILYSMYLENFPIVMIDKYFQSIPLNYVVSDNFDGGYQATEHLIELGHRKIVYIANPSIEESSSVRDRFFGYCKALYDHGLDVDYDLVALGVFNEMVGDSNNPLDPIDMFTEKMTQLLDKNRDITGIVAENDYVAIWIKKALHRLGIGVPRDISIVGFDNVEMLERIDISLTTIDQDFQEIGRKAAKLVLNQIENHMHTKYEIYQVPVKLVVRNSTRGIED